MEFSIKALSPEKKKTGCLVLGVWQGAALTRAAQLADKASKRHIAGVLARGDLSGRTGSTLLLHAVPGLAAERVLLVGLGEQKEFGETNKIYESLQMYEDAQGNILIAGSILGFVVSLAVVFFN